MKKVNQLLLLCLFFAFAFGCKKDGEGGAVGPSIVGKYKESGIKGSVTIDFLGQKATEPLDEAATNVIVEFKSDGTVTDFSALGDDTKLTKYTNTATQITLIGLENGKECSMVFNYKLSNGNLIISMDKNLFNKNLTAISAAGGDSDLADLNEFLTFITDISYEQTFIKQ